MLYSAAQLVSRSYSSCTTKIYTHWITIPHFLLLLDPGKHHSPLFLWVWLFYTLCISGSMQGLPFYDWFISLISIVSLSCRWRHPLLWGWMTHCMCGPHEWHSLHVWTVWMTLSVWTIWMTLTACGPYEWHSLHVWTAWMTLTECVDRMNDTHWVCGP